MAVTFAWNELATGDVEAAMQFYGDVLDWSFERFDLPDGPYWVASSDGVQVGGVGGFDTAAEPGGRTAVWTAFVRVDRIGERFARALALGAASLQAPHDVPNVGRVAVLCDPPGAVIGWLDAEEHV